MMMDGSKFDAIVLEIDDFKVLGTPTQLQTFISSNAWSGDTKRFCFDLDNTLVTQPLNAGDYTSCRPIVHMVQYLRTLHVRGHYIIIHTARRMRTHQSNIGRVLADVGKLTIAQLEEYEIPYHELIFGKPYADFYIDDKAVLPYIDLEKETGIPCTK